MRWLHIPPTYYEKKLLLFTKNKNEWKEHILKTKKIKNVMKTKVFKVDDIDVNKMLVSKKEPYGANKSIKYFIGYNDDDIIIRPLCIKLSKFSNVIQYY